VHDSCCHTTQSVTLADHCVAGAVITVMPEITALKGQLFERNNENCCPFSAVIFAEGVAG
ncbi:MAG: hypothetical protein L0K43_07275, partial [Bifidobacterium crudilactis]|nr:hypothetical protein [Bifidobacterium crudilactis]